MTNAHVCGSDTDHRWSDEARQLVVQARVLSGDKLLDLLGRLQRLTGNSKDACWRFIRQHGLKKNVEHRRWSDEEFDRLREELAIYSLNFVAKKLGRSQESIRSILTRNGLSVRSIRCDIFSVESLSSALHVSRREVLFWIEQGWLVATTEIKGKRCSYTITPEALTELYRTHLQQLIRRGLPNRLLFEAYIQYCHVPKHTTGNQLLDVRRDKKERQAFASQYEEEER